MASNTSVTQHLVLASWLRTKDSHEKKKRQAELNKAGVTAESGPTTIRCPSTCVWGTLKKALVGV